MTVILLCCLDKYNILDERTKEKVREFVEEADVIFISGGDTFLFLRKVRFYKKSIDKQTYVLYNVITGGDKQHENI